MKPIHEITFFRPVVPEWYNEIYAIHSLGFVWMAFDGLPTSDHPKYCDEAVRRDGMRVRQLMSPDQLADKRWQQFFADNNGSEANGTEPLAYTYCSSGCSAAMTPDLLGKELADDLRRLVFSECDVVPFYIGDQLVAIVRKHLDSALQPATPAHADPERK